MNTYGLFELGQKPGPATPKATIQRECWGLAVRYFANEIGPGDVYDLDSGKLVANIGSAKEEQVEMETSKIFTHDEAMLIVEMFEDVLTRYGIIVPSPEDDEKEDDNEAALYGSTYSDLLDGVEEKLIELLGKHKLDTEVVEYEFSGTV